MEEHSITIQGLDDDMLMIILLARNLGIDGIIEYGIIFAHKYALQEMKIMAQKMIESIGSKK